MIPLPSLGITVPVRVCDRCYNDIGGTLTKQAAAKYASFSEGTAPEDKPERQRERRSAIVDELASRVQTSSLAKSGGKVTDPITN